MVVYVDGPGNGPREEDEVHESVLHHSGTPDARATTLVRRDGRVHPDLLEQRTVEEGQADKLPRDLRPEPEDEQVETGPDDEVHVSRQTGVTEKDPVSKLDRAVPQFPLEGEKIGLSELRAESVDGQVQLAYQSSSHGEEEK